MSWKLHIQVIRDETACMDVALPRSPVTIGAAADNDLVLSHAQVSAHHGTFIVSRGEIHYQDSSRNGTFQDGRRLSEITLGHSGRVSIPPFQIDVALVENGTARNTLMRPGNKKTLLTTPIPQSGTRSTDHAGAHSARHLVLYLADELPGAALRQFPLEGTLLRVGRGDDADICLPEATVSRTHAEFLHGQEGWELVDLNSANGTFLNGRCINRAQIRGGEAVAFGNVATRIEQVDTAAFRNVQTQRPGKAQQAPGPVVHLRPLPSHDHAVLIRVAGSLEIDHQQRFTDGLSGLVRDGYRYLVLDLGRVSSVSADVIACLARLCRALQDTGGDLCFAGLSNEIEASFRRYGHENVLQGHNFANAVQAVRQLPESTPLA